MYWILLMFLLIAFTYVGGKFFHVVFVGLVFLGVFLFPGLLILWFPLGYLSFKLIENDFEKEESNQ